MVLEGAAAYRGGSLIASPRDERAPVGTARAAPQGRLAHVAWVVSPSSLDFAVETAETHGA